ncbi:chromosome segregation and condensation protein ScpA [Gloeothece citriformis PCC 7424]|uniref:Segregation and condensation protein A n=1 Tax=Gloeothece citriformis (strain PCC 7424) TaxID=65393 RepID=B7K9I3_GLOC7|nr:segregation/condensation protein A [Gloeothece citriformis]ACK69951.1 chromosome segregation and condensation protein ScpA [Gloeothece citriformis PCC 7424]
MTTTPASAAIATLIEMAQQGEIDPWDVQVIDVIDRFLMELGFPQALESGYTPANLSRSGQTFLWASMLVLLKADTLESLEQDDSTGTDIEPELLETLPQERSLPLQLERHIRRRSSAPPVRKRRVTLNELIEQLQQIGTELEKVSASTAGVKRSRSMSRSEALKVITQLAHQENLTELASQLDEFFQIKLPQLAPNRTSVELEELLDWWTEASPEESSQKPDRVGVFWALLLLTSQSKVELSQTEFYQDLQIQLII